MRNKSIMLAVASGLAFLDLSGCANKAPVKQDNLQRSISQQTNDADWETADLQTANLNADLIKELFDRIGDKSYKNIHSVLLVRNGKLVVEKYFPGQEEDGQYRAYQRNTLHGIHSATKSVNSILIGIAIDQHLIKSVDEKISAFFPEYAALFANNDKD